MTVLEGVVETGQQSYWLKASIAEDGSYSRVYSGLAPRRLRA